MFFSGDLWQLPPIGDNLVTDKNKLDGRLECSPSHWKENFKIYYLDEKMRSQKDPYFSSLSDRVARGRITEEDRKYLLSRVMDTETENQNENFKLGKICIIVTTNPKREFVNHQKLTLLLPNEKEYSCTSTDRVTNLPGGPRLSCKDRENPNKTGNMPNILKVKVKAPVVITSNHSKAKYREDGIVNGARGYIQSIQVKRNNPDQVEIIWVIFNNDQIGKQYRFDHKHLRENFNPGHPLATPILPERKSFTPKGSSVRYQRTNFPLSLAYALTAHKCQGETLEEVIVDFGADKENKISNYICNGSFYVAITRVREGCKLFLRSFETSFIAVNEKIEEKVNAMRKFDYYRMKKYYLEEKIFSQEKNEVKLGYLNINGLIDGNHGEYLNTDKNLLNLHILVLAETKLDSSFGTTNIMNLLSNWDLIGRYDANDNSKHMGLLILASKCINNRKRPMINNVLCQTANRNDKLQIQGLTIKINDSLNVGFLYCRTKPTDKEVQAIIKYFQECQVLFGDLNLSIKDSADLKKLKCLCNKQKEIALKETTRILSNNQLDHILVDKKLMKHTFVTSFFNFISDHKSIVFRFGGEGSKFTDEASAKINFKIESHLKRRKEENIQLQFPQYDKESEHAIISSSQFQRRMKNPDMATCWLNACLQLVLTALDHSLTDLHLNSELGKELLKLQKQKFIDPSNIKEILVDAENFRIAVRRSEIINTHKNEDDLNRLLENVNSLHLNLSTGQQCVRDFFVCLKENLENWIDVYEKFQFTTVNTTTCLKCKHRNSSEQNEIYMEMDVPPDRSRLSSFVEEFLTESLIVEYHCQDGCNAYYQAENKRQLKSVNESQFLLILLRRSVMTERGPNIVKNKFLATFDLNIRCVLPFLF